MQSSSYATYAPDEDTALIKGFSPFDLGRIGVVCWIVNCYNLSVAQGQNGIERRYGRMRIGSNPVKALLDDFQVGRPRNPQRTPGEAGMNLLVTRARRSLYFSGLGKRG